MNETYIRTCLYNGTHSRDKYCPNFRIFDIILHSGAVLNEIVHLGGIIDINIKWDCNLDYDISKCLPTYSFRYLGAILPNKKSITPEDSHAEFMPLDEKYYVEFASHYGSNDHKRLLTKVNGIQFLISFRTHCGKFNLLKFSMNVGSSMALFGTATLICDLVLVYFSKDRKRYRQTISRLGTLTHGVTFIARLKSRRGRTFPPPKPIIGNASLLKSLIEAAALQSPLPSIHIDVNDEKKTQPCAIITENPTDCPSLIPRKFPPMPICVATKWPHNVSSQDRMINVQSHSNASHHIASVCLESISEDTDSDSGFVNATTRVNSCQ